MKFTLKSDSHLPKNFFYIYFNDSLSKVTKNVFYFIVKALLIITAISNETTNE